MVNPAILNTVLASFVCAFGISLGVVILLGISGAGTDVLSVVFTLGTVVLSYFFYHVGDMKRILAYSLVAIGILLILFPMFMYLGIPRYFPYITVEITASQALLIGASTGIAALLLALAIVKSPFRGK